MTPWRDLAIVGLVPLLALGLGAGVWRVASDAETHADAAQARLVQALARPAPSPEVEAAALLVPGQTAGLAASAFQALALARVQEGGVTVSQVEPGAAEAEGPLMRLPLTLRLSGTEAQLMAGIAAIEAAVPLIFIDRLDLQGSGEEGGVLTASLALSARAGQVQP